MNNFITETSCKIFWGFSTFEQFPASQVKKDCAITRNWLYEVLYDLPNGLRLSIVRNGELLGKHSNLVWIWLITSLSFRNKLAVLLENGKKSDIKLPIKALLYCLCKLAS